MSSIRFSGAEQVHPQIGRVGQMERGRRHWAGRRNAGVAAQAGQSANFVVPDLGNGK